jgi:hypothetical protein
VYNGGVVALTDITIAVHIGSQAQTVRPEQVSIAPQTFAPYRATFAHLPADARASASLQNARWHTPAPASLSLEEVQGKYATQAGYGLYVFSAVVVNNTPHPVEGARLIVTLLDAEERVVSYRVLLLGESLPAYARQPVRLTLVPLVVVPSVRYVATLEELPNAG